MSETRHAVRRMRQRGISESMIDLAFQYGRGEKDRVILGRKGLR